VPHAPVSTSARGSVRAGRSGLSPGGGPGRPGTGVHYKWIALSNTTLGMLMATINASIMLIALPDIFRGIGADHDRRTKYAADINPAGTDYGDALALPDYGTAGTVAGSWYDPPRSGAPQDSA
jgi:hypothetical protein